MARNFKAKLKQGYRHREHRAPRGRVEGYNLKDKIDIKKKIEELRNEELEA